MSLSNKYIISSNQGFDEIFKKPELKFKRGSLLLLAKRNKFPNSRLGIAIKKKDYKLAVHRNSLKRNIKNSFKDIIDLLPRGDYVIVVNNKENINVHDKSLGCLWSKCIKGGL